ncbi:MULTISPECIES: pyridoxamine 5'-phosphate oxidase family protein [unclassified Haladaptatus]|uniref:pyridoxamine 5'-phosphate oxidase family protein n=1 Tax=unclassified Haladaptatus TaxID=2622732 RepID=UPI0023E8A0EF|nr:MULTISPECIES: pyridoxamine 5'-phosphate oxidase family protein [unclassified Haladaptatus]
MSSEEFIEQGGTMTDTEIDFFLRSQGYGVLSLAAGDEAYGVPVSFGYDGDHLYFMFLQLGPESQKLSYASRTHTASFLAYQVNSKFDWQSAIVTGTLREIRDDEVTHARDTMEQNAWHPSLFSEADPMGGPYGYVLDIESKSGRKGQDA